MAYDAAEVGSLRFLAGNLMFQLTKEMLANGDDGHDADVLDDASLLMDVISSYYTEKDEQFQKEWARIEARRTQMIEEDGYVPGEHRDGDVDLRMRELKAMFRSLCRKGTFVFQEPESAGWDL